MYRKAVHCTFVQKRAAHKILVKLRPGEIERGNKPYLRCNWTDSRQCKTGKHQLYFIFFRKIAPRSNREIN